jgi:hypothetical protein
MVRLIGKLAYAVGYIVGTVKWWPGVYVRRNRSRKSGG